MTTENSTTQAWAATARPDATGERMNRKQFNSFLYDLYRCEGKNDVTADAVYEAEDYYVEVFTNSPAGLIVAVHLGFSGLNYQVVDVFRPQADAAKEGDSRLAKTFTRSLRERVVALAMRDADVFRGFLDDFRAENQRQLQAVVDALPDHLKTYSRDKKTFGAVGANAKDLKEAIDGSLAAYGLKRDESGKLVKETSR